MERTLDISSGLGDFFQKVRKVEIEELKVPDFYISGWPRAVGRIDIRLRKPGIVYRWRSINGTLYKITRWFCTGFYGFKFSILDTGEIYINSTDAAYLSRETPYRSTNNTSRAVCLMLFDQFKSRALPKIIAKVERDSRYNQKAVEAVKKALEPFIPQIVADQLAS